jgi:hypothetical protein
VTAPPAQRPPDLLNDDEPLLENTFTVPEAAPAELPVVLSKTRISTFTVSGFEPATS